MRYLLPCLLFALPVQAESLRAQLFPGDAACYLRQYSDDHLRSHPVQQVTQISITADPEYSDDAILLLTLRVGVRGTTETFVGWGYCEAVGATLDCGMEGDAGRFSLEAAKSGVLMRVRGSVSFEGTRAFLTLEGASGDDREFLMGRVACR